MTGRKKYRKGAIVYAQKNITDSDLFPSSSIKIMHIDIGRGTKGKVVSAADKDLLGVKFEGQRTMWFVTPDLISRRKP